jgi:hypothetical protein
MDLLYFLDVQGREVNVPAQESSKLQLSPNKVKYQR